MKRHERHDSVDKELLLQRLGDLRYAITINMVRMRIAGALYQSESRLLVTIDDMVEQLGEDRRRFHDRGTSQLK